MSDQTRTTNDIVMALVRKHFVGFTQNPGGAEMWHPKFGRLQIPYILDSEDYALIVDFLRKHGVEP